MLCRVALRYAVTSNAKGNHMAAHYLRDTQLAERYGVSRATIWRWHRDRPDMPRVVRLSPGCVRWVLAEIEAWEQSKAEVAA